MNLYEVHYGTSGMLYVVASDFGSAIELTKKQTEADVREVKQLAAADERGFLSLIVEKK
jgi:D-alanine-D-alanine ligase-like ATP-grasp enzyme